MVSARTARRLSRTFTAECTRCGTDTPYNSLAKSATSKNGVLSMCKPCYNHTHRSYIRKDWFAYKTNQIRREAKKKNVPCEISKQFLKDLWEIQQGKCALTGQKMDLYIGESYTKASLDQIEPGQGYTRNNVQLVTDWANRAKLQLSVEDFGKFILGAAEHIKKNLP